MFMELGEFIADSTPQYCFIVWVSFHEVSGINMRGTFEVEGFRIRPTGKYCNSASVTYEVVISP